MDATQVRIAALEGKVA